MGRQTQRWTPLLLLLLATRVTRVEAESVPLAAFESVPALSAAILESLEGAPCVRLLTTAGAQGCATVRPVMGDLRELSSEREELDAPSVLLLNASLLLPVLARARTDPSFATHVMGVLVAHSTRADAPASFSPQAPFPQVALSSTPNSTYVWNPAGSDDVDREIPFPLMLLSANATTSVRARAAANAASQFTYPRHAARLHYKMHGRQDTYTCLAAGTCEPLGGYSVWSSLPPPPLPTDETAAADNTTAAALPLPTVVVLAKLDAQGVLFHEAVTGADASMSSLLQLLATVHLLSSWAATVNADRPVRRRLAFAALAGEDWGYLGSTSLVRALREGAAEVGGVTLDQVEAVLELGALGLAPKPSPDAASSPVLYLHRQQGGDPAGPDALSRALAAAVPGTGVHVQPAATAEGGAMPPGPLQAFLREREATAASFAAVTVTEYSEVYRTTYAGGPWDGTGALALPRMAQAAVALARTLAALQYDVGPEDDGVWPVDPVVDAADAEQLMRQLSDCLLEPTGTGLKCALLQSLMTPTSTSPRASLYMGVLHAVPPNPQTFEDKGDVARFVWNFMGNRTGVVAGNPRCTPQCTGRGGRCVGSRADAPGVCVHTAAAFVSTLQPALSWAASNGVWAVNRSLVGDAPVYCESMWPADIGTHTFIRERPQVEWVVLLAGSVVTGAAALVSFTLSSMWHKHAGSPAQ